MAVGAAAAGRRVILHLMFGNFIYTGMDAIAHQMAKLRMMTGGQMNLPITVIAGYGGGRSLAAQHWTPLSYVDEHWRRQRGHAGDAGRCQGAVDHGDPRKQSDLFLEARRPRRRQRGSAGG
jgi:hypothetical protein